MNEHNATQETTENSTELEMIAMLRTYQPALSPSAKRRLWLETLQHAQGTTTLAQRTHKGLNRLLYGLVAALIVCMVMIFVYIPMTKPLSAGLAVSATTAAATTPLQTQDRLQSYRAMLVQNGSYLQFWYQAPNLTRLEHYAPSASAATSGSNQWQRDAVQSLSTGKIPVDNHGLPLTLSSVTVSSGTRQWMLGNGDGSSSGPVNGLYVSSYERSYQDPLRLSVPSTHDSLSAVLSALSGNTQATLIKEDTSTVGRKTWLIQGEYDGTQGQFWIDQEYFLILKQETNKNTSEVLELELNTPLASSTFALDLSNTNWQKAFQAFNENNANHPSGQDFALLTVPFTVYTISLDASVTSEIVLSTPTYDPLTERVSIYGVSRRDPFGSPAIMFTEQPATNASMTDEHSIPANDVTGFGFINQGENSYDYDWVTHGTRVSLHAASQFISAAQFKALVQNIKYHQPMVDTNAYAALWRNIAKCAPYAVYAPVMYAREDPIHSQIEGMNLVTGMPQITSGCGVISLPFYFTTKPGIGVQLTEYKGNTAFNTQAPIRIDSQLTQAFYEINGERHALTIIQDGTTIRFEALVNEVSKDDLVKLAGQLQLIGK